MSRIVPSSSSKTHLFIPPWLKGKWGAIGIVFLLYIFFNLAWTYFHWGGPQNVVLIANVFSFAPSILASLLAWRAAAQKSLGLPLRRAWFILGLSFFMFLIGNVVWAYLEVGLHLEPFPSLADVFYLAFYPLGLWGLLSLPRAAQDRRQRLTLWLDMSNILAAAGLFVGYFIIIPTAATSTNDLLTRLIAPAYPIGSLFLLGGIVALLYRRPLPDTHSALSLLLLGMLFFVGGDMAFGYTSLIGIYHPGGWTDASWNVAQLFFGLAALRDMAGSPSSSFARRFTTVRDKFAQWLPWLAAAFSYGLVGYVNLAHPDVQADALLIGAGLLTLLLIARQIADPTFTNISLRAKLILAFLLVAALSITLVTFFTYLNLRSNVEVEMGRHLKTQAEIQAQALGNLISKQIDVLEGLVLADSVRNPVLEANAQYLGSAEDLREQMNERDRLWKISGSESEFVRSVLDNRTSMQLHGFLKNFPGFTDVLITDQYGAVIAATSRPIGYLQSKKEWWRAAYAHGKGAIYIGQPILHSNGRDKSMMIAMPIWSSSDETPAGVIRVLYNPRDISNLLRIPHHDIQEDLLLPNGILYTSQDELVSLDSPTLTRLSQVRQEPYVQMSLEGEVQLVSQAPVNSPDSEEAQAFQTLNWTIIIHQDPQDALAPVNAAWKTASLAILVVLILAAAAAVLLAQLFVAPISRLTAVAEQIAAGNVSAKAKVESGDEIGTLAKTFNSMLDVLAYTRYELQESETHYRNLVDYSPDMIAVNAGGKFAFINPAGAALLGAKSVSDLIGKNILDTIPEPARRGVQQHMASLIASGQPTPLLNQTMYQLNGRSFDAEYRAIPITYAGQPAIQFVGRDITERKKAEAQIHELLSEVERQRSELEIRVAERTEELKTLNGRLQKELSERQQLLSSLRESEERFRLLFDASPDAIFLIDPHSPDTLWPVVDCNQAAGNMNGYTRQELLGQSIDLLNVKKGTGEDFARVLENLRRQIVVRGVEVGHIRKDGHIFPIEYSTTLIKVGEKELVLGIDRDITERKQSEEALNRAKEAAEESRRVAEEASRAKSEFLSRMSHELRTPMNAILGFAQLLELSRKEPLTAMQKERVRQIVKGGQHLLDLINEILDISRIEANRLQISPEPVSVRESIQEVLDLIIPLAVQRQIQVVTKLGNLNNNPFVMADRQRLKQILLNLLGNAVKYNYDAGAVVITCKPTSTKSWHISITDTGPGISLEDQARLFVPFERLVPESTGTEGTGLGLVLAKRLVELMHGQLGLESIVGKGSTFWIELPAAESPMERLQRLGGTGGLPLIADVSRTLLYVEDNVANFELIQQVLADYSQIELLWAADAKTGLEIAHQRHPNIILLDLHLGAGNGVEVLQQLKRDTQTSTIPVIVITADATSSQSERLMQLGAASYLTKPIDVKHFIHLIEDLLVEKNTSPCNPRVLPPPEF